MKKILFLAVCMLATTATFAQKLYGGPQVSFNISAMGCSEVGDRAGFQAGGFIGYEFTKVFGLELQAFYSLQGGANTTWTSTTSPWGQYSHMENHRVDLHYINVPLLAKFNVTKGFMMCVGPQIGFLADANVANDSEKCNVKDLCNSTDFGIMMGVGYQFKFGLRIVADYTLGLTKIIKDETPQNRVFSVKAAWRF